jgi:hypothetical protein
MSLPPLHKLLRGPFNFLRPDAEELRRLLPSASSALPLPQRIFLEDEGSTPIWGFPLLMSPAFLELREATQAYLLEEETSQAAAETRQSRDPKTYNEAWVRYRDLLTQALENVTLSSYGRSYPGIFWLAHSIDIARCLKDTPRRLLRIDLELGRTRGDKLKYRVFDRIQDRILSTTYDLVNRLAIDTEEMEEELFPRLLRWMLDNVLIFTEDRISHDLTELDTYFRGYLNLDGRDFRRRLEALTVWHGQQLQTDAELRNVVANLLDPNPEDRPSSLLSRRGYVTFLANRSGYQGEDLLPLALVQVWESLLLKLKEFEVFHALRRYIVPIQKDSAQLLGQLPSRGRPSGLNKDIVLSTATRPMDFMASWVVDPQVDRFGLVYDITDFSSLITELRRAGQEVQDASFRMMFRFQRRINRLANSYRMKLEKYLGDGAFYSSRHPRELLICAVRMQRYYVQALEEGLSFDRGLRIALNYGSYRLIPLRSGGPGQEAERYEFFGHGVVELSRLTTGKTSREMEEVKNMLIRQGYPQAMVDRFFAPLTTQNLDFVEPSEERRRFFAYINRSGNLINEGIVATGLFIESLEKELGPIRLYRAPLESRRYVVLEVGDEAEQSFRIGLRKLGIASLKGLDRLAVYEVIDGVEIPPTALVSIPSMGLLAALDREYAASASSQTPA